MEIMEMQQDLMEHTLVYYYKLESNAGLPAPKWQVIIILKQILLR
jgi:hypothetical protein